MNKAAHYAQFALKTVRIVIGWQWRRWKTGWINCCSFFPLRFFQPINQAIKAYSKELHGQSVNKYKMKTAQSTVLFARSLSFTGLNNLSNDMW